MNIEADLNRDTRAASGSWSYESPLQIAAPNLPLEPYCSALLRVAGRTQSFFEWIPASGAQILISLAGRAYLETCEGTFMLPRAALIGPLSRPARLGATKDYIALGACLRPVGLIGLRTAPADRLVDRAQSLEEGVSHDRANAFLEQVTAVGDAFAKGALRQLIGGPSPSATGDEARIAIIERWMRATNNPSVGCLSHSLGLSLRQTERFTAAMFGFTPKVLGLRHRALSAARDIAISNSIWPAEASERFYDQSHLIQNMRRFIGTTPSHLARGCSGARSYFIKAHAAGVQIC